MAAPKLLSSSSNADTFNIASPIVLTFDMPIVAGEGELRLDAFARPVLIEDIRTSKAITIAGNTLTIDPPQDLAYGSVYHLYLPFGLLKNPLTGEVLQSAEERFTTLMSPQPLHLNGTSGDDYLIGSNFDDTLSGGDGSDNLVGMQGNDRLDGGAGRDWLDDSGGNNTLTGGDGDDSLSVSGDDNTAVNQLDGGAGNDWLTSYRGIGTLLGGAGDDTLVIDSGGGTLNGGDGDDFFSIGRINATTTVTGGAGSDRFFIAPELSTPVVITDFTAGKGGDLLDPYTWMHYPIVGDVANLPPVDFLYTTGHAWLQQDGADTLLQTDRDGAAGQQFQLQTVAILRNTSVAALTRDNFWQGVLPSDVHMGINLQGGAGGEHLTGGTRDDALRGGMGDDRLDGQAGNDFLDGGDGNDRLAGMAGNDGLYGGSGNDTLEGGAGDDLLDGDAGWQQPNGGRLDSAVYDTAFANVRIGHTDNTVPDVWFVKDSTGALGNDTLAHIERLHFTDKHWALDVGIVGNAGSVYRLYQAAFDRQPDIAGLSYWLRKVDAGLDLTTVADSFTRSDEFRQLFGASPSNAELVTRLYKNVLHREPEPQGHAYWIDILEKKHATVAYVLEMFSSSPENFQNVAKIIGNGFAYEG